MPMSARPVPVTTGTPAFGARGGITASTPDDREALIDSWRLWPTATALRWLLLAAVGLFLLVSAQQLGQAYVIDEAEFPYIAEATSSGGLPIYYHGELRPTDVGIFHPPLYAYALAGWIQAFGNSHEAVRSFGVLCALLTAAAGAATLRLVVPRWHDAAAVGFVALYLLNPLTIASAILPDIDGTLGVLSLTLGLYVLVIVVTSPRAQRWHVPLAGLALGFAMSTKLTTPLALVPLFAIAFLVSTRRPLRALADFAATLAVGVGAFLAWWGPLAAATTLDFSYPFQFTYDSLVNKSGSVTLIERLALLRPHHITLYWLDPLLLLLTAAGGVFASLRARDPRARAVVLLVFFALGTVALYDVITTPVFRFPKYWIAAVPAATVVTIWLTVAVVAPASRLRWRHHMSPVLLALSLITSLGISIVTFTRATDAGGSTPLQPLRPVVGSLFAIGALGVLLLAVVRDDNVRVTRRSSWRVGSSVLVGSCVLVVGLHGMAQSLVLRSATYSTRYYFGERGFAQAVEDVRSLTPGGEAVLGPKDIGFEAKRPFYEDALLFPDPAALERLLKEGTIAVAVTRKDFDYSEPVFPTAFAVVRKYMVPVFNRPGEGFIVWKLRPEGGGE